MGYFRPMRRLCILAPFALLGSPLLAQRSNPAGPDQFICGTAALMQADPLGSGETGVWTIVQGTASFANQSSPTTLITNLSFGENVLRWTIYPPGGSTISDLVSIWCYNDAMPDANAGPDQSVTLWPGSVQLAGSAPIAPGACFWIMTSGSGTIADPTSPTTTVGDLSAGTIVLEWSCDNGPCGPTSDFVTIDVAVGIGESRLPNAAFRYDAAQRAVVFSDAGRQLDLSLYDQQGRLLRSVNAPAGAGMWKLEALPSGLYTLVALDSAQSLLRFVVNR